MSEAHLLYRVAAQVAYFTINREPQRNALSRDAVSLFLKYLDEAEKDEHVRVILISGSGDRAFCSGADLADAAQGEEGFRSYARLLKRLDGYSKPVVAKIVITSYSIHYTKLYDINSGTLPVSTKVETIATLSGN